MRFYETLSEKLLKDEKAFEYLSNFHSSKWDTLSYEDKKQLFINLENKISELLNEKPIKIKFKCESHYKGVFSNNELLINGEFIKKKIFSPYDYLNTYFHERRHKYQADMVVLYRKNKEKIKFENSEIALWEKNHSYYPIVDLCNYFNDGSPHYNFQPVERDAFKSAHFITMIIGRELEKKYGKDNALKNYVNNELIYDATYNFPQNNHLLAEILQKWEENYKAFSNLSDNFKTTIKKVDTIDKLKDEEIYNFFFEEIWVGLTAPQKAKVLTEFDKRESQNEKRNTVEITNKNKKVYLNNEEINVTCSSYALNNYYSLVFKDVVVPKLSEIMKKWSDDLNELELNLYQNEKGEEINFYDSVKDPFLYLIQPYALYESKYMYKKLKKISSLVIKGEEFKNKPGTDTLWAYIVGMYDVEKIEKLIEDVYDKPYKEVYDENLEKMKERIKKIENKKTQSIKPQTR